MRTFLAKRWYDDSIMYSRKTSKRFAGKMIKGRRTK
jgi:hypothetical protein